jgi:hypothetical protein
MERHELTIEHQYKEYLRRADVKEENMPPDQRYEIRRAFYGAVVQTLLMLRDDLVDYCKDDDDKAEAILEDLFEEGVNFWEGEVTKEAAQIEEIMEYRKKMVKAPSALQLASELFRIHSYADIESQKNPDKIVYTEDSITDLLKKFGFPQPDWDGLGVNFTKKA